MAPQKSSKKAVHVRVMADAAVVEKIAEQVGQALEKEGAYELVETSAVYPCRAPQEDQGRIYLTMVRRAE